MIQGTIYDLNKYKIGDYIYLDNPETDQSFLDQMCDWFLEQYEKDNRFFLSYDLETQGLNPKYSKILLHSIAWRKDQALLVRDRGFNFDKLGEVLKLLPIAGQNIKFDAKFSKYHYNTDINIFLDTMVAATMGYTDSFPGKRFSLDNIVANHFPFIKMNKQIRNSFIDRDYDDDFTLEEVEYAVGDSILTYWLVLPLLKRLILTEQWEMFKEMEMPVLKEFVTSELHGIPVDYHGLGAYYEELGENISDQYQAIQDKIEQDHPGLLAGNKKFTKGVFNPGSSHQVPLLLDQYGIKVPASTKDILLSQYAVQQDKILGMINDYRTTCDKRNKLVKNWYGQQVDTSTFRTHANFMTYGANTGRFAVKEPPMQTVTEELRKFVVAEKGYSIVQYDYSSFEFRACAAVTGQKELLDVFAMQAKLAPDMQLLSQKVGISDPDALVKAFTKGNLTGLTSTETDLIVEFGNNDIHRVNASLMLGIDINKVLPTDRTIAKCVDLDTLVTTNQGIRTLRSLLPAKPKEDTYYPLKNLKVLSDTGWKESPEIYYNGKKNGYKIRTKLGREIKCTNVHKFRTLDKNNNYSWKLAADLSVGNVLITNYQRGVFKEISEENITKNVLVLLNLLNNDVTPTSTLGKFIIDKYNLKYKKDNFIIPANIAELLKIKTFPEELLNADWVLLLKNKDIKRIITRDRYIYGPYEILKLINLALQNSGVTSSISTENHNSQFTGATLTISNLSPERRKFLALNHDNLDGKSCEDYAKTLKGSTLEDWKFLCENNLHCDPIVSIQPLKELECGDLVVPDGNTLTYNGIIAHNTFGYATLYGSGAGTIRDQLAKDQIFYPLTQVTTLIDKFYYALNDVKRFIDDTHVFVEKNGYSQTPLGRRRYFNIPPKWKTNMYVKGLADAKRAAVNHILQGCNADAIKIAITGMMNEFRLNMEPENVPIIILQVHDELVLYCKDEFATYVADICKKWMIEGGQKSTLGKVHIAVSGGISPDGKWMK